MGDVRDGLIMVYSSLDSRVSGPYSSSGLFTAFCFFWRDALLFIFVSQLCSLFVRVDGPLGSISDLIYSFYSHRS